MWQRIASIIRKEFIQLTRERRTMAVVLAIPIIQMSLFGYALATEGEYGVAVATKVSAELMAEGLARELVRRLQTMRRSAGFDIADYIVTYYSGEAPIQQVMVRFADYIKQETLSYQLIEGTPDAEAYTESYNINGNRLVLGVKKVS